MIPPKRWSSRVDPRHDRESHWPCYNLVKSLKIFKSFNLTNSLNWTFLSRNLLDFYGKGPALKGTTVLYSRGKATPLILCNRIELVLRKQLRTVIAQITYLKKNKDWGWGDSSASKVLVVWSGEPTFNLNIHIRWLITACYSSSMGSDVLLWPLRYLYWCVHTVIHTHTHTHEQSKIFKMNKWAYRK